MKDKNLLKEWEEQTTMLANAFAFKYFGKDCEYRWIGDEIGGILAINDYFFNLERIVEALRYKATTKKLFAFHDLELDFATKNKEIKTNFKNYIKYGKNL